MRFLEQRREFAIVEHGGKKLVVVRGRGMIIGQRWVRSVLRSWVL